MINERIEHSTIFLFERVNASLIEHEIMELNSNKASRYDCIPPKTLKDSVSTVKDPLTQLFNTSVKDNLFPSDLKYANVSPLFKKDDNTNKENYRPISIYLLFPKFSIRLLLMFPKFYHHIFVVLEKATTHSMPYYVLLIK